MSVCCVKELFPNLWQCPSNKYRYITNSYILNIYSCLEYYTLCMCCVSSYPKACNVSDFVLLLYVHLVVCTQLRDQVLFPVVEHWLEREIELMGPP